MERKNGVPPIHPGAIIKQDISPSVGLSVTAAAKALGVSRHVPPVWPKLWADAWLLAFAECAGGAVITFDRALAARAGHTVLPG